MNLGKIDQAIDDYNEAIRLDPYFWDGYYNRGMAYFFKEDYEQALSDFSEAIRVDADKPAAYTNRGWTYHQIGNLWFLDRLCK